jgi:hypothetical protein
MYDFI